ncbi:MAG: hypothetical protein EZS28_010475 [Streblomastix strix]|uniref:Uncharacterized protein n=1 Tax=Streblomastix strix TaxID=222440 RepID=A0A5J4WH45_9EUKA|nr:MAG: hypothetical protein EZS28_010475 [Streblomastix strix]
MNELERIVVDGTDDNRDADQSEHTTKPKHFTNGNNGLRKNDSGTQLQAIINGEANHEINITKISTNTSSNNVNGLDGLGGYGCRTQLYAATNENEYLSHQAIDNTGIENNYEQANNNKTGRKKPIKDLTMKANMNKKLIFKIMEILNLKRQYHFTQPIPNKSQKIKIFHQSNASHPQSLHLQNQANKTGSPKSIPDKPLESPEAKTNSDSPNHFIPQQEQRKKADVAPVTENKSAKRSKGNRTSAGSKKLNQGSNSENQIEPDYEIDQPEQLD